MKRFHLPGNSTAFTCGIQLAADCIPTKSHTHKHLNTYATQDAFENRKRPDQTTTRASEFIRHRQTRTNTELADFQPTQTYQDEFGAEHQPGRRRRDEQKGFTIRGKTTKTERVAC